MAASKALAKLIQDAQQQVALQAVSLAESGGSPRKAASLRQTKILHSTEEKKCISGEYLQIHQLKAEAGEIRCISTEFTSNSTASVGIHARTGWQVLGTGTTTTYSREEPMGVC